MYKFVSRIPMRTIVYLVVAWILFQVLSVGLKKAGFFNSVPLLFPITVFEGPTIHLSGIVPLFLFLVVLICAIRLAPKLTILQVWLIGFSLIILGNLGQGNWDSAFSTPFNAGSTQYYHDAIKITSWSEWLESFNSNQQSLLGHTQTHPPFAVLSTTLFFKYQISV